MIIRLLKSKKVDPSFIFLIALSIVYCFIPFIFINYSCKNTLFGIIILISILSVILLSLLRNRITKSLHLLYKTIWLIIIFTLSIALFIANNFTTIFSSENLLTYFRIFILIQWSLFFLFEYKGKLFTKSKKKFHIDYKEIVFIIFIFALFIFLGIQHLGKFMTVDEPKWLYTRVPQYINAIKNLDFESTYINDKPGVLPSILSGISYILFNIDEKLANATPESMENLLFWWRLPIVIFNAFNLIVAYLLSKNLLTKLQSKLFIFLTATSPFILGISQIVNPDATLWSTSLIAILSFFSAIKTNQKKFVLISGIYLGLAFLSKFFTNFVLILFLIYLFHSYIYHRKSRFLRNLIYTIIIISISILIYSLFFPYSIIHPKQILNGTVIHPFFIGRIIIYLIPSILTILYDTFIFKNRFKKLLKKINILNILYRIIIIIFIISSFLLILNTFSIINIFDAENYPVNKINNKLIFIDFIFKNLNAQLYRQTLLITFLFNLSLIYDLFSKKVASIKKIIYLFTLIYIFSPSLLNLSLATRHQVILFPLVILLSILNFKKLFISKIRILILFFLIISCQILSLINSTNLYYIYTNELNGFNSLHYDSWGIGGYEFSQIVNKKIENKVIWSDREGFCEFSKNHCIFRYPFPFDGSTEIDYLVLTESGKSNTKRYIYPLYEDPSIIDLWEYYYIEKTPTIYWEYKNDQGFYYKLVEI